MTVVCCTNSLIFRLLVCSVIIGHKLQLKTTNHKKKPTPETEQPIIYVKAEDEIFHKVFWYSIPVP